MIQGDDKHGLELSNGPLGPRESFEFGTLAGAPRLSYVRFVPNALHLPGLLPALAADMARRADAAREHLHEVISPE